MNTLQREIINKLGVKSEINPEEEIQARTQFLVHHLATTGATGYALGISGGQDSLLAGLLAKRAVEQRRANGFDADFHPLLLPYGTQLDRADAEAACAFIQPDPPLDINIQPGVDAIVSSFEESIGGQTSDFNKGNVKARARMVFQYLLAGHLPSVHVVGTDHAAEAVVGFFTKHGDGAADILPLAGLDKRQGRAMLRALGAPEIFVTKPPTADLLDSKPGQTDEEELGLGTDQIDDYLEGKAIDPAAAAIIEERFVATMHKRELPVSFIDELEK